MTNEERILALEKEVKRLKIASYIHIGVMVATIFGVTAIVVSKIKSTALIK